MFVSGRVRGMRLPGTAASDLGGLGPGEVDAHGEAPGEDRSARGVVAQGRAARSRVLSSPGSSRPRVGPGRGGTPREGPSLASRRLARTVPLAATTVWGYPTAAATRPSKVRSSRAWIEPMRARRPTTPSSRARLRGSAGASGSESESRPGRSVRTRPVASRAVRKPWVSRRCRWRCWMGLKY